MLQQRLLPLLLSMAVILLGFGFASAAEKLTTPTESLGGWRPGTLTVNQVIEKYGKPKVVERNGLLGLYGGAKDSKVYGWFMVDNPDYNVPDIVVETSPDSDRVELVMAIGYDGIKTEKGISCFNSEAQLLKAYGKPDFVFAVPMNGFVLREFYYTSLGISFDVAPTSANGNREVIAIYVTFPEYLQRAIDLRKKYIKEGTGKDVTDDYKGGIAV